MEIIQQRLIWLMGTISLLIILSRMAAHRLNASQFSLSKIKIGLFLLSFGSIAGIIGRLGIINSALARSGMIFFLENIVGCLGGWSLILWGIMEWVGDKSYTPTSASRSRAFSEKLAKAVVTEHSTAGFLNQIAKYLFMALDCDGLSVHIKKGDNRFELQFQSGFDGILSKALENPSLTGPIVSSARLGETVALHKPDDIHAHGLIATSKGATATFVSIPLESGSAIMGLYFSRQRKVGDIEFEIIDNMASTLSSYIRRDNVERSQQRQLQIPEIQSSCAEMFKENEGLYSPLIKSIRLIDKHIPVADVTVYISGDGPVQSYEFPIRAGARLVMKTGHFAKAEYPFLPLSQADLETSQTVGARFISSRNSVIVSGNPVMGRRLWLEVGITDISQFGRTSIYIFDALCDLLSTRLSLEDTAEKQGRFNQLLGAIQYLQEKAISGENVSSMLQEAAQAVVETGLYPFCRITLSDPAKGELKTAALAQVRPLNWQLQHLLSIPLSQIPFHKKAILECLPISFDRRNPESSLLDAEACLLLPEGTTRGRIVPIALEGNAVGLITVGDFRNSDRYESSDSREMFLADLAGLLSMLLTWHKEKRTAFKVKEGQKKLTMKKQESLPQAVRPVLMPGVRTRLNGPLAGILASCEYLKDNYPGIDSHVGQYLNVIERNAERIHKITAGLIEK